MALKQPQDIFRKIAVESVGEDKCPTKASQKFLGEEFSSSAVTRYRTCMSNLNKLSFVMKKPNF